MLHIDGTFYLYLALMILVLPLPWVVSALAAAAFHELCHLAVLFLVHGKSDCIRIKAGGAEIHAVFPSPTQELLCAAAGPAGSLFLLSLHRFCPRIALCAGFQGIFNLLPIYPLDGGRILLCLYSLLAPNIAISLHQWTQRCFLAFVLVSSGLFAVKYSFYYPLFFMLILALTRKIPCKQDQIRVQ